MKKHISLFLLIAFCWAHPASAQSAPWPVAEFVPRLSAMSERFAPDIPKEEPALLKTDEKLKLTLHGFPIEAWHDGKNICKITLTLALKNENETQTNKLALAWMSVRTLSFFIDTDSWSLTVEAIKAFEDFIRTSWQGRASTTSTWATLGMMRVFIGADDALLIEEKEAAKLMKLISRQTQDLKPIKQNGRTYTLTPFDPKTGAFAVFTIDRPNDCHAS